MSANPNSRLETFTDGVLAIAITLLILEIKVPSRDQLHSVAELKNALAEHWTSWFAFGLSFLALFIGWTNHHRMMSMLNKTSPAFIYAHGFLLLTISVYPFVTSLLAEYMNTSYAAFPVFLYCLSNMIHAFAWVLVYHCILWPKDLTKNEVLQLRAGRLRTTILYTVVFNALMCVLAFFAPLIALILTAMAWIVYLILGIRLSPLEEE
ncbi:MAG: TMEM175 family protein [Chitinophagales bacterium]